MIIYITISTFTSVRPYGVVRRRRLSVPSRPTSDFYHVQSFRSPVRPLLSKAKPSYVYSIFKPHGQSSKSQVIVLLSEAKPSCVYSILKPHGQSSNSQVRLLLSEAKPSYVYSILKPPGQSSRSPVRLLLSEAKPSYVYLILKPHVRVSSPPQSRSQAVVCISTPRKYPLRGYILGVLTHTAALDRLWGGNETLTMWF